MSAPRDCHWCGEPCDDPRISVDRAFHPACWSAYAAERIEGERDTTPPDSYFTLGLRLMDFARRDLFGR